MTDETWRERLAEWQGGINAVVRELNKNQDELDKRIVKLWKAHASCREEMLRAITVLQTIAKQEGKRWGVIFGIISGIVVGIVSALIFRLIGL